MRTCRHFEVLKELINAATQYRPYPLAASVHYFAAEPSSGVDPSRAWRDLIGTKLTIDAIGGNHHTIVLEDELAAKLGAAISQRLAQAEQAPAATAGLYKPAVIIQMGHKNALPVLHPRAGANVTSPFLLRRHWIIDDRHWSAARATMAPPSRTARRRPRPGRICAEVKEIAPTGPYHLLGHRSAADCIRWLGNAGGEAWHPWCWSTRRSRVRHK
jgi:hypothetical protein